MLNYIKNNQIQKIIENYQFSNKSIDDIINNIETTYRGILFLLYSYTSYDTNEIKGATAVHQDNIEDIIKKDFYKNLDNLIQKSTLESVSSIPILDIHGLTASKSPNYYNLDLLANHLKTTRPNHITESEFIRFQNDVDFENNKSHIYSQTYSKNHIFSVYLQKWDNRKFLDTNGGGSNHLAAIYRQCCEQGKNFYLSCKIESLDLNKDIVIELLDKYFIILTPYDNKFIDKFKQNKLKFIAIQMKEYKIQYIFILHSDKKNYSIENNTNYIHNFNNYMNQLLT